MKQLITLIAVLSATTSMAAENLICGLVNVKDSAAFASVEVKDIRAELEDYYLLDGGVDVADDSYSFDLVVEREGAGLYVNATFYENVNVQDEVGQEAWLLKPEDLKKGQVVVSEPIYDSDDNLIMDFVCFYNTGSLKAKTLFARYIKSKG